jgi:hypothetical protein
VHCCGEEGPTDRDTSTRHDKRDSIPEARENSRWKAPVTDFQKCCQLVAGVALFTYKRGIAFAFLRLFFPSPSSSSTTSTYPREKKAICTAKRLSSLCHSFIRHSSLTLTRHPHFYHASEATPCLQLRRSAPVSFAHHLRDLL